MKRYIYFILFLFSQVKVVSEVASEVAVTSFIYSFTIEEAGKLMSKGDKKEKKRVNVTSPSALMTIKVIDTLLYQVKMHYFIYVCMLLQVLVLVQ